MTVKWFKLVLRFVVVFTVSSSDFYEVNGLLYEHCAKNVQRENISTPNLQSMCNAIVLIKG